MVTAKEYTFALIKPTAMANGNADAIFAKLAEAGFKVAVQDERTLSREFVEEFYGEHKGRLATQQARGARMAMLRTPGKDCLWR